jgi:uncharacterized protein YbjQ (UPF0145 family)
MQTRIMLLTLVLLFGASGSVPARDTKHMLPINAGTNTPAAKDKLATSVAFYFGKQVHPRVAQTLGIYTANRKTNAFNKSDQEACEWAFLSALLALRDRAVQEGGDAVINIKSFYKKNEVISNGEYECHAGGILAGVALQGTVVRLAK